MSVDGPDREHRFRTAGGVEVARRTVPVPLASDPVAALAARVDRRRGVLLASSYEYPAATPAGTSGSPTRRSRS